MGQRSSHVLSRYGPHFLSDFGYLVDRAHTHHFPFLGALVLLAGCMLILHMSHSLDMLVIDRLLEGCAGALVMVAAFALLNASGSQECLGQTLGYLSSAIASRILLGPFLGGLVYHGGGYDAVFYVAYSIIAINMGMRMATVEKKAAEKWDHRSSGEGSSGHSIVRGKRFVMFQILRQRRVLISSWALLVQGIFLSAFDAVRCNQSRAVNVGKADMGPDTIHLR